MTKFPGSHLAKKKDGSVYYRASMTYKNKHISLGSFNTPEEAHQCYKEAKVISTSTIGITGYNDPSLLSFEKWVSIINFRDNNYYFKNPIYLYKKYFVYYLSTEEELFFDIDDLFYYSNHKIHRRQGYYFVNDFGMQVNILNRYGIKNHAVVDKDYVFIDGNPLNYRYDNIEVLNPYYGVAREHKNNKLLFKASININGSYIIGRYETAALAAIAYNKTVDFLSNYNISTKNFPTNYIEGMDSKTYLSIYKDLKISKKIIALFELDKMS